MTYWNYIKDNNMPRYVHSKSNHPQSVIKNIPKGVNKRLSENSANEQLFKAAIPNYHRIVIIMKKQQAGAELCQAQHSLS